MENVTTPGQIIFLFLLFFAFCVMAGWWLFSGKKEERTPVDFEPTAIIGSTWTALLHWRPNPKADEPERTRSDDFPLPTAIEPETNGSENRVELQLNAGEVAAIHRMIEHNKTAAKPSKSSTIHAGFGVSRGGSAAYTRASLIYDALFGAPAPAVKYRERTPEQEALRKQLNLN